MLPLTVACLGFSCLALGFTLGIRTSAPDTYYDPFPGTTPETPLAVHGVLVVTNERPAQKENP